MIRTKGKNENNLDTFVQNGIIYTFIWSNFITIKKIQNKHGMCNNEELVENTWNFAVVHQKRWIKSPRYQKIESGCSNQNSFVSTFFVSPYSNDPFFLKSWKAARRVVFFIDAVLFFVVKMSDVSNLLSSKLPSCYLKKYSWLQAFVTIKIFSS